MESQVVFQAKTQAKNVSIELPPRVLRMVPKSTMHPQMANAYESNHTSRALQMWDMRAMVL